MDDYSIYTGEKKTFGTVDYVLFSITLVVSAGIGFFFAVWDRKNTSTVNFQLAARKMGVFPVAMSLLVTYLSALSLLGNPVEVYNYNTMFWYLCLAIILAVLAAMFIFVPFFYKLGATSIFEYLELRFDKYVRLYASIIFVLTTMLYLSFVLYAPSIALTAVTGINLWASIIGIMLIVTAYTALGGMKAVVWTDTFQAFVIVGGLLAVLIRGSIVTGGLGAAWEKANDRGRIVFDVFDVNPSVRHSFWSVVIGGGFFWGSLYGVNQAQIQRAMALPSITKSQISLLLNLVGIVFIMSLLFLIGVVMFAFYSDCHPVKFMNIISKSDQLLPLFVMDILGQYEGLPGIFVSCIFSGSLSSLSSSLNALSAVCMEDIFKKIKYAKEMSDLKATLMSKALVVFFGLATIGLAFLVDKLGALLQASYSITSITNGPVTGLFILGIFFPWANKWGAMVGSLTSMLMMSWIGYGAIANKIYTPTSTFSTTHCNWNLTSTTTTTLASTIIQNSTVLMDTTTSSIPSGPQESSDPFYPMYTLSYMWYTATGILIQIVVGLIVSFITGHTKPSSLNPSLYCPLFCKIFPCLPDSIKRKLRCGVLTEQEYENRFTIYQDKTKNNDVNKSDAETVSQENVPGLEWTKL